MSDSGVRLAQPAVGACARGCCIRTRHLTTCLVEDGDTIAIDAEAGTIDLLVEPAVLDARRAQWQPRQHDYQSGALWRYAQNVGPAWRGAVTHPGAASETHVFADI